ncbi:MULTISPECIES: MFS transporter [Gilliamella]|uniref:MFS transporter n=1 Tax=Gilliamella TaxID=1193503 RepID=UPI00080E01D5|nr:MULTISPECIES: MFS transporter [Gilliamella]MBI0113674.1 MFS transporter [Gilliamella sp. W8123]MBI0117337.1 MFS transporter [Gilliamella sp. W8129]OCG09662.1 glucarate transporter [Gilliamella apis]OTQ56236.1 MFS transporter [Gilliamella apis]OTQ61023.1 MFS transporter [Gilliamella apis]
MEINKTKQKRTNARWMTVVFLFIVTAINYGDRATLGIAGKAMSGELGFDAAAMGWVMSSFGIAYVIGQLPGGWLLDRFGSKRVYFCSILFWSIFTLLQGTVHFFIGAWALIMLFTFRFLMGLAEAPSFPGNSRITAAWFPAKERATAVAIFNSAQYFATVIFAPIMGWLTHEYGWQSVFFFMGGLGIFVSAVTLFVIRNPKDHPLANQAEVDYIVEGGALVDMDQKKDNGKQEGPKLGYLLQLLTNRMLLGVYLGQYCINCLTFFFITWFPIYLATQRGMNIKEVGFAAAVPAICGFIGGISGGVISDFIMRKTNSLSIARKTPIILGMLFSMTMIMCNYVDSIGLVILFMSMAFFGKGVGALGWAVMADTAPKEMSGLAGGLFNMFGNASSIISPIIIGYIVAWTGRFEWALVFVAGHAFVAAFSYLVLVGPIKRMELKKKD